MTDSGSARTVDSPIDTQAEIAALETSRADVWAAVAELRAKAYPGQPPGQDAADLTPYWPETEPPGPQTVPTLPDPDAPPRRERGRGKNRQPKSGDEADDANRVHRARALAQEVQQATPTPPPRPETTPGAPDPAAIAEAWRDLVAAGPAVGRVAGHLRDANTHDDNTSPSADPAFARAVAAAAAPLAGLPASARPPSAVIGGHLDGLRLARQAFATALVLDEILAGAREILAPDYFVRLARHGGSSHHPEEAVARHAATGRARALARRALPGRSPRTDDPRIFADDLAQLVTRHLEQPTQNPDTRANDGTSATPHARIAPETVETLRQSVLTARGDLADLVPILGAIIGDTPDCQLGYERRSRLARLLAPWLGARVAGLPAELLQIGHGLDRALHRHDPGTLVEAPGHAWPVIAPDALARAAERQAFLFDQARHWAETVCRKVDAVTTRRDSRLADATVLLTVRPALTVEDLEPALDVKQRTARKLARALLDADIAVPRRGPSGEKILLARGLVTIVEATASRQ